MVGWAVHLFFLIEIVEQFMVLLNLVKMGVLNTSMYQIRLFRFASILDCRCAAWILLPPPPSQSMKTQCFEWNLSINVDSDYLHFVTGEVLLLLYHPPHFSSLSSHHQNGSC